MESNTTNDATAWETLLPSLQLTGLALNAIEHAEFISKEGSVVSLRVNKGHQSIFTTAVIKRIEQGLANHYKDMIKLALCTDDVVISSPAQKRKEENVRVHALAANALQSDPFFQQLQEEFSAELVKNSIEPLKDEI
jgi:DNA polymerase-3 subunit gamma/tau